MIEVAGLWSKGVDIKLIIKWLELRLKFTITNYKITDKIEYYLII